MTDDIAAAASHHRVVMAALSAITVGAVVGALTWVVILSSPLGRVSIDMRVDSSAAGSSQMFFSSADREFTEYRSVTVPVRPGANDVTFTISDRRETLGPRLRWDPLNAPADIVVTSATVGSALVSVPFPIEYLVPSVDISSMRVAPGSVAFSTLSNDPQALLDVDLRSTYQENSTRAALLSIAIGTLAGLGTLFVALRRGRTISWQSGLVALLSASALLLLSWALQMR